MKWSWIAALAVSLVAASPAWAGPPWITVELPANPFDRLNRGAFLFVHAFHHNESATEAVTGRAVGIVDGRRQTVPLAFERTSRPGVYALKNTWGDRGDWALVLTNSQGHDGWTAEVMVRVSAGRVVGVDAATKPSRWSELSVEPRAFTEAEIEAAVSGRAPGPRG